MKILTLTVLVIILITGCSNKEQPIFDSLSPQATPELASSPKVKGTDTGGGGDPCENRIQAIRDDIKEWISNGGYLDLELPVKTPSSQYKDKMIESIDSAVLSCTDEKLLYQNVEKTCLFSIEETNSFKCNFDRFNNSSEEEQYVLIHHEYAGISGFEVNNNTESDYTISNQISGYLDSYIIKKLTIRPAKINMTSLRVPDLYVTPDFEKKNNIVHYTKELYSIIFPTNEHYRHIKEATIAVTLAEDWYEGIKNKYTMLTESPSVPAIHLSKDIYISLLKDTTGNEVGLILFDQHLSHDGSYKHMWYVTIAKEEYEDFFPELHNVKFSSFFSYELDAVELQYDTDEVIHCIFNSTKDNDDSLCSRFDYEDYINKTDYPFH